MGAMGFAMKELLNVNNLTIWRGRAAEGDQAVSEVRQSIFRGDDDGGLGGVPPDAEGFRPQFRSAQSKLIGHLIGRSREFLLQYPETLRREGLEPLAQRDPKLRVDQLFPAALQLRLKRVAREDRRDPPRRVPKVRREGILADPGILQNQIHHRFVRVAHLRRLDARRAWPGREIGGPPASQLGEEGGGIWGDGYHDWGAAGGGLSRPL